MRLLLTLVALAAIAGVAALSTGLLIMWGIGVALIFDGVVLLLFAIVLARGMIANG